MSSSPAMAADRFLPAPLTAFVGRERELAGLRALLARRRRAAPDGDRAGGVGKTRLALVAARLSAAGSRPGLVCPIGPVAKRPRAADDCRPSRFARRGQARCSAATVALGSQSRCCSTTSSTCSRRLRGVALLSACPEVTLFVTSRTPLRISGEQEFQSRR